MHGVIRATFSNQLVYPGGFMLKYSFLLAISALATSHAQAAGSYELLTCSVTDPKLGKTQIQFGVRDLDRAPKAELVYDIPGATEENGPILVTLKNGKPAGDGGVVSLNGQGGDLRFPTLRNRETGKQERVLQLFGDDAGCVFVYLNLYENSDYTRGSISVEFPCGDESDKWFGKASCTRKTVR